MEKTKKEKLEDRAANAFAIELLMPEDKFVEQYRLLLKTRSASEEDQIITDLAKIFQVPLFAVVMRMQTINLNAVG